ncbi:MAG TPA: HAMP domain-containing sensor histidine kinase, partial [Symbiobacteriaceae bacterium]|nr:HAMP domain-containing sensor histidine kinase [Symbiobacteriaceae bacterium]
VQAGVAVGVTLATLLVIWVLSRRLVTAPMERLAAVAVTIGEGNLTVHPSELSLLHRSRELGIVADSMENMAGNLRELYANLEHKVTERTRELAQANQLQTQFLATVSHELRTPLTSIIAFTELLLKQDPTGRQKEYLEDVLESSRRLLVMVNDLLDLSRLSAGRVELFTDVLDLPELVCQVERSVSPLAEKKGISLITEPMADLPPVLIDPLRMKQVLLNLLGNAIKFTPEGGSVHIGAQNLGEFVQVHVRDTGPGIPPDQHKRIFEAFRRIEAPGHQHPGSGLGLALARNLVELHGGRIWVENPPEGGSLFCFTVPIASTALGPDEEDCDADDQIHSGGG